MDGGVDISHPIYQEDLLIEQEQSSNVSDHLEAKFHFLLGKREEQSLKDTFADNANMSFGLLSPRGVSALVTPNDDDPLVWQASVDQLRCERSFGPSHVVDGGGDASQVDTIEAFGHERPFGLTHVDDGAQFGITSAVSRTLVDS
jgi:hypothetical protein